MCGIIHLLRRPGFPETTKDYCFNHMDSLCIFLCPTIHQLTPVLTLVVSRGPFFAIGSPHDNQVHLALLSASQLPDERGSVPNMGTFGAERVHDPWLARADHLSKSARHSKSARVSAGSQAWEHATRERRRTRLWRASPRPTGRSSALLGTYQDLLRARDLSSSSSRILPSPSWSDLPKHGLAAS